MPEHLTYFARYERDSAALQGALARTARSRLRAYVTTGDRPVPARARHRRADPGVHPWRLLAEPDRKDFSFVADPWLERGAAVALLGYDLAPAVRMDTIVASARRPRLALPPRA